MNSIARICMQIQSCNNRQMSFRNAVDIQMRINLVDASSAISNMEQSDIEHVFIVQRALCRLISI